MQLQVVHVSDGNRGIEILTGTTVAQSYLTVTGQGNTLPQCSVCLILIQIFVNFRKQFCLMFLGELIPLHIDIIICQIQSVHNVFFVCTVKDRSLNVEAQCLCSQGQMDFQDLSDIHTRRHTQRIQYDIQRTTVRQIRHILYRQYAGNNTLVTVTTSHLVTNGDLSLLCDIDANLLVYTR